MLKFVTEKGRCTIEFRNSSNGYYSGSVEFEKKYPIEDKHLEYDKHDVNFVELGDF